LARQPSRPREPREAGGGQAEEGRPQAEEERVGKDFDFALARPSSTARETLWRENDGEETWATLAFLSHLFIYFYLLFFYAPLIIVYSNILMWF